VYIIQRVLLHVAELSDAGSYFHSALPLAMHFLLV
jgi:hypothetical protein